MTKLHSTRSIPDPDETVDLNVLIAEVIPDPESWKNSPNPLLGGKTPADFMRTPQAPILRDMLRAAKHGMFS